MYLYISRNSLVWVAPAVQRSARDIYVQKQTYTEEGRANQTTGTQYKVSTYRLSFACHVVIMLVVLRYTAGATHVSEG